MQARPGWIRPSYGGSISDWWSSVPQLRHATRAVEAEEGGLNAQSQNEAHEFKDAAQKLAMLEWRNPGRARSASPGAGGAGIVSNRRRNLRIVRRKRTAIAKERLEATQRRESTPSRISSKNSVIDHSSPWRRMAGPQFGQARRIIWPPDGTAARNGATSRLALLRRG